MLKTLSFRRLKVLGVIVVVVASNIGLAAWCWSMFTNLSELKLHWDQEAEEAVEKAASLAALERAVGYGGFIHNFKNYVIRRNEDYRQKTAVSFRETMVAIESMKQQAISAEDREQLQVIQETFEEYGDKFVLATTGEFRHMPVSELDRLVKVDDTAALGSLKQLRSRLVPDFLASVRTSKESLTKAWKTIFFGLGFSVFFLLCSIPLALYVVGGQLPDDADD